VRTALRPVLISAALLALPGVAIAADAPAQCAAMVDPTGELAPWTAPSRLTAGKMAKRAPAMAVGKAADVKLSPTPEVKYALAPEKAGGADSYGGVVSVDIAKAATYRVALGAGAWIDVVRKGKAVTSTKHGHGPACTGVRKMVDFPLERGRYTLQLAGSSAGDIRVLVAQVP
jgi:hypothetical protein